jgi:hypothetical protein
LLDWENSPELSPVNVSVGLIGALLVFVTVSVFELLVPMARRRS